MERETMKRSGLVLGLLLILSVGILAWRGTANKLTAAEIEKMDMQEPLLASYYEGQESKAYKMLQKSIFKKLLDQWTGEDVHNPVWNYDSFTSYQLPDSDRDSLPSGTEIYCCTYSEDNGKYGFVVIAYEGSGLSKICLEETPYPFDLKENIEDVMEELKKTDIDLSTASAVRERINDGKQGITEAVRITDRKGNSCLLLFDEKGVALPEQK